MGEGMDRKSWQVQILHSVGTPIVSALLYPQARDAFPEDEATGDGCFFVLSQPGASRLRVLEENKLIVLGLRVGTTPQLTHLTSITPVRGGQGLATRGSDGFFGSYVASRGR